MRETIKQVKDNDFCVLVLRYELSYLSASYTRISYQSFLFPCERFKIVAWVAGKDNNLDSPASLSYYKREYLRICVLYMI